MIGQPMIDGKKNKAVSSLIIKSLAAEDNHRVLALWAGTMETKYIFIVSPTGLVPVEKSKQRSSRLSSLKLSRDKESTPCLFGHAIRDRIFLPSDKLITFKILCKVQKL